MCISGRDEKVFGLPLFAPELWDWHDQYPTLFGNCSIIRLVTDKVKTFKTQKFCCLFITFLWNCTDLKQAAGTAENLTPKRIEVGRRQIKKKEKKEWNPGQNRRQWPMQQRNRTLKYRVPGCYSFAAYSDLTSVAAVHSLELLWWLLQQQSAGCSLSKQSEDPNAKRDSSIALKFNTLNNGVKAVLAKWKLDPPPNRFI